MPKAGRTRPCNSTDARNRVRTAEAYLVSAELVLSEVAQEEFANVAAGIAVLAGIAASDAICCIRLKRRHSGQGHSAAVELLKQATPDGQELSVLFSRLLSVKNATHYGITFGTSRTATDSTKWAKRLIERAREEIEG
jgi:hypothetical protein